MINRPSFLARLRRMSVSYFKRFRMEIDLRGQRFLPISLPAGYWLIPWQPERLADHAEAKYHSFRQEIDADVFTCLADLNGCYRLMQEISLKDGFLPEATWLAACRTDGRVEYCGTIQGIRANHKYGAIQNVGITPTHRGRGIGTALIHAALDGLSMVRPAPRLSRSDSTKRTRGAIVQAIGFSAYQDAIQGGRTRLFLTCAWRLTAAIGRAQCHRPAHLPVLDRGIN